jgi:NodT family efflux transporter outer membrane factor (OMF) lipoprotein
MKWQYCGPMALSIACTALAACSVGSPYQRPDIESPTQWREQPAPNNPASPAVAGNSGADTAATVWPAADWWRGFGSAQLNALIDEAQRSNDDLAGAIARVEEADAQARIAGAALLPAVNLGATGTRERIEVIGASPRLTNLYSPALSASYEIDFWGKNRALRASARATAVASRYDQQTVALAVISSVATTYFHALEMRDRIQVVQQTLESEQKILRGLQLEQSVGTATGLDVAQQASAVAALNATVPPLVQELRQTVYAMAVLIGRTPESIDIESGSLAALANPAITTGLPSELLARRPDVAEAEQQLISANANITAARAALFPSIQLTADGGYASTALSNLLTPANQIFSAGASLTQPIFHGGALTGALKYSKARQTELLRTYHKAVITAFSNVESALVAARQTTEQLRRQQDAVAAARRAYQYAQAQMSAGTVNILTVLNTENALFTAQDALVQVEYSNLQALVNLFTALGGGWHQG